MVEGGCGGVWRETRFTGPHMQILGVPVSSVPFFAWRSRANMKQPERPGSGGKSRPGSGGKHKKASGMIRPSMYHCDAENKIHPDMGVAPRGGLDKYFSRLQSTRSLVRDMATARTKGGDDDSMHDSEFEGITLIAARMRILLPFTPKRKAWDAFIMMLVLYSTILIPLDFGFNYDVPTTQTVFGKPQRGSNP